MKKIRVTIWNEFVHEQQEGAVGDYIRKIYPNGIHEYLKSALAAEDLEIRAVSLDQPDQGLPDALLDDTDVLMWWGHCAHDKVDDNLVQKIADRISYGMGLIVLHSGHLSKIFRKMMGTRCRLRWREVGEKERIWVVAPNHPIAAGLPETFSLPHTEMYGEPFDIPDDGKIIFSSWYEGGNTFRSGVTFLRDQGKIFYFSPGHETYPIYYDANIQKILSNAIRWAAPEAMTPLRITHQKESFEKIESDNPMKALNTAALHKSI